MPEELPDDHIPIIMVKDLILAVGLGSCPDSKVGNSRGGRLFLDAVVALQITGPAWCVTELSTDQEVLG